MAPVFTSCFLFSLFLSRLRCRRSKPNGACLKLLFYFLSLFVASSLPPLPLFFNHVTSFVDIDAFIMNPTFKLEWLLDVARKQQQTDGIDGWGELGFPSAHGIWNFYCFFPLQHLALFVVESYE